MPLLAKRACLLGAFVAVSGLCFAQRSLPGTKLSREVKIDGKIEPGEWDGAATLTSGFDENTGGPNPDPQEFWFAYDEKFVYIAARLADREPAKISATETRMNVSVKSEDHIVFAIDPFGNLQNLNQFRVNPNGATTLEIAGGRAPKREWIGEILAAGRITAQGWECEARIPWSIMKLPAAGKREIRADFGRYIPRTGRSYITSNISGDQMQNVTRWTDVEVPRATEKRVLQLLQYGYAGWTTKGNEVIANSGLDMKTSLTDGLDFVGTINPDFRNIENAVLSLDFSYFERLAGESRPFFLEGANFFQTSEDGRLFASQRIRSFDAGTKVYGKFDDRTTLAFLNTNDFGHESAWVGNVQHQFRPRESMRIAGTLLDKHGMGNSATFLSYDRGVGNYQFYGQVSTTHDDVRGDGERFNSGVVYQHNGLFGFAEYQQISPDFFPRLGFAPVRDFKGWNAFTEWTKQHRHPQIMETEIGLGGRYENNYEGRPFRRSIQGSTSLTLRDATDFDLSAEYQEFQGFKDHLYEMSFERPRGNPYRYWSLNYAWGRLAGHDFDLFGPVLSLRPIKSLQVSLSYQELHHIENESQTILSANYEANRFESISGRVLKRNDDTNFYLAWRRAGNRGIEYYLILGDPNARTFRESIILKAVVPIEVVLGKR